MVCTDYFAYRSSKIKQKQTSGPSILTNKDSSLLKDVVEIVEIIDMLSNLVRYCKMKIKQGWQRAGLLKFIETLLTPENNHKIRLEALNLFLLFLDYQSEESVKEISLIYASIINFQAFEPPPIREPRILSLSHCVGKDETGILAARIYSQYGYVSWTSSADGKFAFNKTVKQEPVVAKSASGVEEEEENLELIEIIIKKIIDSAINVVSTIPPKEYSKASCRDIFNCSDCDSLKFQWKLFKMEIMKMFFPSVSRILDIPIEDNQGFKCCPTKVLDLLLNFLKKNTTTPVIFGEAMQIKEMATALLHELILNQEENREIIHEVLRQSMMYPTHKAGIFIISTWIMASHLDKYEFLAPPIPFQILSQENLTEGGVLRTANLSFNITLRRYLNYLRLSTLDKKKDDELFQSLSSVLIFFREIALENVFKLDSLSWELLLSILMEIQNDCLIGKGKDIIASSPLQGDCNRIIADTVIGIFILSRPNSIFWEQLANQITTCRYNVHYVKAWTTFLTQLTKLMVHEIYGIQLASPKNNIMEFVKLKVKNIKSTGGPLSPTGNRNFDGKNIDKKEAVSSVSNLNLTNKLEGGFLGNILQTEESYASETIWVLNYHEISWLKGEVLVQTWKEILCVIGKIEDISNSMIHSEAISCIVKLWELLEPVRKIQQNNPKAPKIDGLDLSGILFIAAGMPVKFSESIALAGACLCKEICKTSVSGPPVNIKLLCN